ncbi:DUF952 domain-containing protein [Thermomonospora amylolytica]|uniref:DUF952 domain-containing protein n=1 Tax=Thermomonospora amylolytica TaxID=1411117 RepID=UPI000E6C5B48|nr:DUF952 domain-containing protein [Thermomonospora amylolytica]
MGAIFHVAYRADWDAARAEGRAYAMSTRGRTLDDVGFVHCAATEDQVIGVLGRFYQDVPPEDLVLLVIDPAGLDVRYEPADGEMFPHIHEALPLSAVIDVRSVPKTR